MSVSLRKGEKVSLDKGLKNVMVGLGWDVNQFDGADFDLDASAFLLKADGKVRNDYDFIFYNNLDSRDGSVHHTGDNRTGAGEGDDEVIMINLEKISQEIQKIAITVTIHDAYNRHQNFGQVHNAYVRLCNAESFEDFNGQEILHYDLEEDFSLETAIVVCEIYRKNNIWKFNAVGAGYSGGLKALCAPYGIDAED